MNKKSSNWGIAIFFIVVLLGLEMGLRLWRLPLGIGVGILLLISLPWAIKSWWKTLQTEKETRKENSQLRKENETLKKQVIKN